MAEEHGVRARPYRVDVSDYAAVHNAVAATATELDPPAILVNNAAITDNFATVESMGPSDFQREVAINLMGAFHCTKECLVHRAGFGRIVNISSGTGRLGGFGQASYAASKAGLLGLTKTIALETARDGVTCNAVLPGLVDTATADRFREDLRERIIETIPVRRMAKPEEVANVVDFLIAEQASYVNGAELAVEAGQRLFTF
jgi:NAD(P)-dependent dehydrogenase (short-subunit alcohol dehydrogenase family)